MAVSASPGPPSADVCGTPSATSSHGATAARRCGVRRTRTSLTPEQTECFGGFRAGHPRRTRCAETLRRGAESSMGAVSAERFPAGVPPATPRDTPSSFVSIGCVACGDHTAERPWHRARPSPGRRGRWRFSPLRTHRPRIPSREPGTAPDFLGHEVMDVRWAGKRVNTTESEPRMTYGGADAAAGWGNVSTEALNGVAGFPDGSTGGSRRVRGGSRGLAPSDPQRPRGRGPSGVGAGTGDGPRVSGTGGRPAGRCWGGRRVRHLGGRESWSAKVSGLRRCGLRRCQES